MYSNSLLISKQHRELAHVKTAFARLDRRLILAFAG